MMEDDLYISLHKTINEAMEKLDQCNAEELGLLHNTALTIRGQAIAHNETRLQNETERLLDAIDDEVNKRGGGDWLEAESVKMILSMKDEDIQKFSMVEIMVNLQNCEDAKRIECTPELSEALKQLKARLEKEVKRRGLEVIKNGKDKKVKMPRKLKVPSPLEIIQGKSDPEIPNN